MKKLVDNQLEVDCAVKFRFREGGGEQDKGGEVEAISVKMSLPPHADPFKSASYLLMYFLLKR